MQLTYQDIQDILQLLDESPYDELNLQTSNFTLALKRNGDGHWRQQQHTPALDRQVDTVAEAPAGKTADEAPPTEDGLQDLRSPMAGTFYRAPKPGADPFVDVGSEVTDNSVVCIIEVMKLMSSVPAGLSGEIREILVEDAQPVEKDQLLMRVRPAG